MKAITLLVVFCLIASSFATSEEEFLSKIHRMESSKIGNTLLDTIYLQLQTEGPVEDLIRMLQQKEDELQKEQKADDVYISAFQEECDGQLAQWESEIVGHNKRIVQLEEKLTVWIPVRDEKVHSREEKQRRRAQIQERLAQLESEKEAKDKEWNEEREQHNAASYAISKAKQIIMDAVKNKGSFLQTNTQQVMFTQVSQIFAKHAKQHYKRTSWNTIFKIMSSITTNAPAQGDQSLVKRIGDLCDSLLEKIAASLEIEKRDYDHFISAYQNEKNVLDAQVAKYTSQIDTLTQEIDTLNKKISNAQAEIIDNTNGRDQKQALHDDKLTVCDQANVAYSEKRQARHDQIEVVSDAVALLQSHLRLFRQYVSDRLKTVSKAK